MATKKRKVNAAQKRLLKRIERVARNAAVEMMRGDAHRTRVAERKLEKLMHEAESESVSEAANEREAHGRQRAAGLYHKVRR